MPIVDGELVGEGVDDNFVIPDVTLGIYIENSIRKNVTQYGDCNWLVNIKFSLFRIEINSCYCFCRRMYRQVNQ